jgi:hypothetical protein
MWAFGEECVDSAWNAIGAVGKDGWVTRESLNHAKVRPGAAIVADGDGPAEPSAKQLKVAKVAAQHKEALAACRRAACRSARSPRITRITRSRPTQLCAAAPNLVCMCLVS